MKLMRLTAILTLMAGPALADPVEGVWQTKPDDNGNYGHVQVAPGSDKICGVLIKSFDGTGAPFASPNIGKQIIWNMVAEGEGYYDSGKVWSPDRDKTYNANMTLSGDTLGLKGCVIGICRDGGTWMRVK